jgi:hypothetical protein
MSDIHELRTVSRTKNNPQGLALAFLVMLALAAPAAVLFRSLQYGFRGCEGREKVE